MLHIQLSNLDHPKVSFHSSFLTLRFNYRAGNVLVAAQALLANKTRKDRAEAQPTKANTRMSPSASN